MKLFCITALYAAGIFLLQQFLFRKTSRAIFHCIPLSIIGAVYLTAGVCFLTDALSLTNHDGFLFNTWIGWVLLGINTTGLAADGIAWLIEKV